MTFLSAIMARGIELTHDHMIGLYITIIM